MEPALHSWAHRQFILQVKVNDNATRFLRISVFIFYLNHESPVQWSPPNCALLQCVFVGCSFVLTVQKVLETGWLLSAKTQFLKSLVIFVFWIQKSNKGFSQIIAIHKPQCARCTASAYFWLLTTKFPTHVPYTSSKLGFLKCGIYFKQKLWGLHLQMSQTYRLTVQGR